MTGRRASRTVVGDADLLSASNFAAGSFLAPALRVLVVSPRLPLAFSSGFVTRVHHLIGQLAQAHQVTVLCLASSEELSRGPARLPADIHVVPRVDLHGGTRRWAQLRGLMSSKPFLGSDLQTPALQSALDLLLASGRFDVVHLESSQLWGLRLPVGLPVVLDEHNLEYELLGRMRRGERSVTRRLFNGVEHRRFRRLERRAWCQVALCAVTSEREAAIVARYAPTTPVAVVPNGVDTDAFADLEPEGRLEEPESIVFTGLLSYRPNLDAVHHLIDEVLPLVVARHPTCRLTIVGDGVPPELVGIGGGRVTFTGFVPDTRPYLRRASVAVVPVRMGGGTRLKVLEAMAMGKAIVSTSIGCEGIEGRHGEHLLVADEAASFAGAISQLFEDAALRRHLGTNGRRLAVAKYSWDEAGARLRYAYGQLMTETAR